MEGLQGDAVYFTGTEYLDLQAANLLSGELPFQPRFIRRTHHQHIAFCFHRGCRSVHLYYQQQTLFDHQLLSVEHPDDIPLNTWSHYDVHAGELENEATLCQCC